MSQARRRRQLEGHPGFGQGALGPHDALRDGRLRHQEARAISPVVRPPSRRRVSATRASRDSTGWQAMNMRPQQVVADGIVERRFDKRLGRGRGGIGELRLDLERELGLLARCSALRRMTSMARCLAVAISHAPGVGGTADGPLFQGRDQRVLGDLLRGAHVADHPGQPGDDSEPTPSAIPSPPRCEDR